MMFFIIFYSIFFLVQLALFILLQKVKEDKKDVTDFPFVTIMIAARNEQENILACLEAIRSIDYPSDKMEVWIGDDNSNDLTNELVTDFIKDKSNFHLLKITENLGIAKGKANVLAHLFRKAKGEFCFITDADIQVPKNWLKEMLSYYQPGMGTVSGATSIEGKTVFGKLQKVDWLFAFGMVTSVSANGIPVSAVGNNMLITREAYQATGGYENIPFSVTEDFELFIETLKKGFSYKNLLNAGVLATSKPSPDFISLLKQRKRWMSGALRLPVVLVVILFMQALFFPVTFLFCLINPSAAVLIWIVKILGQGFYIKLVYDRVGLKFREVLLLPLYELYAGIVSVLLLIYYAIPDGIHWKGRKY